MPRRDFVDLVSDEETENVVPKNKSLERPPSTPLADRGKQASHSRADQQLFRTKASLTLSQKFTPALSRDKSPHRTSNTTHDTLSSNHDPSISSSAGAKSHASKLGGFDQGGEDMSRATFKLGSARSGALRSSSPLHSFLSAATAKDDSSHSQHDNFTGTSLPPRLTLRSSSAHTHLSTESLGRRSTALRSSDRDETEDFHSLETRSTSRRAPTSPSIPLLNSNIGGALKRRISRSRLGTSSSGQEHIDGEDSDNDNAGHALRDSINAVRGPLSKGSEEAEISEETMKKTRAAPSKRINAANAPRRQRPERTPSSGKDAVQEAASAQLLRDVLELPAKPDPPRLGLEKLLSPSDGLENDIVNDDPNSKARTSDEHQTTGPNPGMLSWTTERTETEMLRKQSPRNMSEDHSQLENEKVILDEAIDSNAASSKALAPLDIEALTAVLKRHEIDMWSDQGYLIKPTLRQAKLDCIQAAQPKLDRSLPDPFAGIVGDSFAAAEKPQIDAKNQTRSKLQVRVFNSSYTQHVDGLIHFDNIEYQSTTSALPKYKSIVRLGPNILAKNDRTLKYMPYFTSEEDPQSRQKKELLDELQKRYDDRVETLPAQRKCSELAEFWRECLEDYLSEIGIGFQGRSLFIATGLCQARS